MRMVESAKNMEPNIIKKPTAMQLSKARIEAESAFNELQNAIGKVKNTYGLTLTTYLEFFLLKSQEGDLTLLNFR